MSKRGRVNEGRPKQFAADTAEQTGKSKAAWGRRQEIKKAEKEAADPSGSTCATSSGGTNSEGQGHTGFATDTAEATGKSKASINRAAARGEAIAPDVLEQVSVAAVSVLL